MSDLTSSVEYKINAPLYDDAYTWRTDINANITTFNDFDEDEIVGKASLHYFDVVNAFYEGYEPFDIFDLRSETLEYFDALYTKKSKYPEIKDKITAHFADEYCTGNILVFDRIEILPKYRGHGLTELLFDNAARVFAKPNDIICLKSYPLQWDCEYQREKLNKWEKKMKISSFKGTKEDSFKKLESYYKKLGFISIDAKGIMVKPNDG